MEQTKPLSSACPVCLENKPENFRIYFDDYLKLYRCKKCSFVAQYPGPGGNTIVEEYADFYSLDFVKAGREWQFPDRERSFDDMAARIKTIAGDSAVVLDVGAGEGHFMSRCERMGLSVTGVEPSPVLAKYAAGKVRGAIKTSYYESSLFPQASFDVVTFIQVLEHVVDPAALLNAALYHLRPGGYVMIEIPSIHAPHFLAYRLTGIKKFVRPPTGIIYCHVGYFSPRSLTCLTSRVGLKTAGVTTGRWRAKYHGLLRAIAMITDPIFNALGIGGILYFGKKSSAVLSKSLQSS